MRWHYQVGEAHTRVLVFMNGALCGELCFRIEEFQALRRQFEGTIHFTRVDEFDPPLDPLDRPTETAQDKKDRDADSKGDADMDKRRAGE